MANLSPQQLTELAEQNPDDFVRMIAEVCYGWYDSPIHNLETGLSDLYYYTQDVDQVMLVSDFNPLAKTERGRSQAFELAMRFDCFPDKALDDSGWYSKGVNLLDLVFHKDPQTAIGIAAYLTAQEMKR